MRARSNSFLIDGQDSYYPSTGGLLQPINNPDIISEVRVITNQFLPEYGRTAGSVMSVVTKSGGNTFHGSLFWFHNLLCFPLALDGPPSGGGLHHHRRPYGSRANPSAIDRS
jgi:hypothetical protein